MDVSGTPVFRGGGGGGGDENVCGVYAVLVCILRFEDILEGFEEEKVRRRWEHGGEANLKTDEVIGTTMTRWRDMMGGGVVVRRRC